MSSSKSNSFVVDTTNFVPTNCCPDFKTWIWTTHLNDDLQEISKKLTRCLKDASDDEVVEHDDDELDGSTTGSGRFSKMSVDDGSAVRSGSSLLEQSPELHAFVGAYETVNKIRLPHY